MDSLATVTSLSCLSALLLLMLSPKGSSPKVLVRVRLLLLLLLLPPLSVAFDKEVTSCVTLLASSCLLEVTLMLLLLPVLASLSTVRTVVPVLMAWRTAWRINCMAWLGASLGASIGVAWRVNRMAWLGASLGTSIMWLGLACRLCGLARHVSCMAWLGPSLGVLIGVAWHVNRCGLAWHVAWRVAWRVTWRVNCVAWLGLAHQSVG